MDDRQNVVESQPDTSGPNMNSPSHDFDAELKLVKFYKEKIQTAKSTMSREYYSKKLDKQIKYVLKVMAYLESRNPTIPAIQDRINENKL